ncbi:MAG: hypothetical protein DRJ38_09965 [Thermoprotei archaeon]|nr:MAG: hypothetical protein DRJ38_09965 [Thermoprotei archaeon]
MLHKLLRGDFEGHSQLDRPFRPFKPQKLLSSLLLLLKRDGEEDTPSYSTIRGFKDYSTVF